MTIFGRLLLYDKEIKEKTFDNNCLKITYYPNPLRQLDASGDAILDYCDILQKLVGTDNVVTNGTTYIGTNNG